jgi:hypothetical protein
VAVDEKAELEQVNALYSLLSNRYASKVWLLVWKLLSQDHVLIQYFATNSTRPLKI